MAKYPEYKQVDYPGIAKEVLSFWEENKVFEKSISEREGAETFTFFEGPPSANGTPGIHHVMARTVKDLFCRYKTQSGFQVKRKGGWDTHGLPVELQVEKELGIKKDDIGKKISIEDYNAKCREAVMKYKDQWDDLTRKMGYWVDLDNPYITFERDYMESVWTLLKRLFDKGLLYKGYTVQPYSPAAGTGLSSAELNMPGTYKQLKDTSIVAQFKVKKDERSAFLFEEVGEDVRILAWTTTPWTLPSNCALAVGEKIDYVKVKTYNPYTFLPISVVLAKDLVGNFFNKKAADLNLSDYKEGDKLIPFEVGTSFKGTQILETRYEQLMPYVTNEDLEKNAFRVIPGDFVSTADGTGVVHTASVFGADDFRVTQQAGVPSVMVIDENGQEAPLVDKQGKFVDEVTDFAGRFVKEEYYDEATRNAPDFKPTDVLIAILLKESNKAFKVEKYEHSYPHCWRTDKPVLYYPLDSWFVKTTALKDRLVELNKTINWKPEATGTGRFGNWLENLVDWNLSRSRYWGTPLPIWVSEDKKELKCIGSMAELKEEVNKAIEAGFMTEPISDDFDLHRPYVDDITLVSDSGQPLKRESDLVDVWFDSGAMPYAQWHYPYENDDIFKASFPADFIAEGVDQTRGWFFTLHVIATLLFDGVAFKNVIANGLVLDKEGNKMSKSKGNAVNPFDTLDKYGPDATRWYMISNANPWDNLKFDLDGVLEVQRKLFGTLANTYSFFALYANIDGFDFSNDPLPLKERTESDRWILSRLNSMIGEVNRSFEEYEPTRAARAIQNFVTDELSNWYVRLNRKRFWVGSYNQDKEAAYQTLYTCLKTISKLMAPIAPFYAERLYADLNQSSQKEDSVSVHLTNFPQADASVIDEELEKRMKLAQTASSLVHSLRRKEKIKVRQPLTKIMIPVLSQAEQDRLEKVEELIISETNVKTVEYLNDTSGILVKKIKPNFRALGATFGPKMKLLVPQINGLDQDQIKVFESEGSYQFDLEGESVSLSLEQVEISSEDIPGWLVASENGLTVALDITLTDDLKKEGLARDVVNRVQNLRKDKGLEVQDKIEINFDSSIQMMVEAVEVHREYIQRETQALKLEYQNGLNNGEVLDIDGTDLKIQLEVVQ
ncbi:MAG: isoleucine--tRNA ligase [Cytophagales bacterium]|nr:isoleucine--tRNA ligase [Cytophagales bacterium]